MIIVDRRPWLYSIHALDVVWNGSYRLLVIISTLSFSLHIIIQITLPPGTTLVHHALDLQKACTTIRWRERSTVHSSHVSPSKCPVRAP